MNKSLALLALLSVAACGGGAKAATGASNPAPNQSGAAQQQAAPGAAGLLAAINGTTLQVQDSTSQTAVTYNARTTFTSSVAAKASDVLVGTCAQVRSAPSTTSTLSAPATAVTATSVTLSAPVNGSCQPAGFAAGRRRFGTGGGGSAGGTPPSGFPGRGTRGFGGGGAFGKVTAVNGSGFTLSSTRRSQASTTPSSTSVTVTSTAATTYSKTVKTTAAALTTGLCVTARGPADSSGTVAATAISLRPATNGSCSTGFGGRGA